MNRVSILPRPEPFSQERPGRPKRNSESLKSSEFQGEPQKVGNLAKVIQNQCFVVF